MPMLERSRCQGEGPNKQGGTVSWCHGWNNDEVLLDFYFLSDDWTHYVPFSYVIGTKRTENTRVH